MRATTISISLFLFILAGFFISGALSPLLPDPSPEKSSEPLPLPIPCEVSPAGNDEELIVSPPALPDFYYEETPTALSPPRSVSNTPDGILVASTEGTIYFMDRSGVIQWELVTGSPFIYSEQAHPDIDYYVDISEDRRLHEYSKNFGHRELNSTIEELVRGTPEIKNFMVTLGSTNTTIYLLDATTGKTILTLKWPVTSTGSGVPMVRDKLVPSDIETGKNYMILIRTDYSLSSTNLRINYPPSSSTGPDGPSWRIMSSHIRAAKIKSALPPNIVDNLLLSSPCQVDIPVLFLSKAGKSINEDHRLPSASHSYNGESANKKLLVHYSGPDFSENISDSSSSPLEIKHFSELSDDNISSLGSPNTVSESENGCKLGHYVADEPVNGFQRQSQNSIILNDNISSISRNIYRDASSYSEDNDHATKLSFAMLTELIYGNFLWFMVPTLLIVLAFWYLKLKVFIKCDDEQLTNLRGSQPVAPKKRKSRKSGNTKNGTSGNTYEKFSSSGEENANGDKLFGSSFINLCKSVDAGDGRWVGKLFVSNSEIGRGSNGTVVLEGVYDGRPVAVKRLLRAHHDVALKEIQNLIASDQHLNIVRLYGVEQDLDFVYISLERCSCTLSDLIKLCSESFHPAVPGEQTSRSTNDHKVPLYCNKGIKKGLELWTGNGFPSSQLLKLMRDMVSGLSHLHELGIIHRDLKPHNVLISGDRCLSAKLSDMGISKRLLEDMSSLTQHSTGGSGSSGWQAPEQLLQGRQSRAVDLFSLGCILFFCITKGRHPFGNHFERDSNIVNNRMDLFLVDHLPEAVHLLSQLLDHNPKMRPNAVEVLHHPFFWGSEMRLSFLRDTSDRIELEDRENEPELLKALENVAAEAFGGKWGEKLDAAFISDIGRYRKYKFDCMRDLLRVIRNKLNHFRELPEELQEILGPVPEGFDKYFSSRFPKLLIEVYKVICTYCRDDDSFSKYFSSSFA